MTGTELENYVPFTQAPQQDLGLIIAAYASILGKGLLQL